MFASKSGREEYLNLGTSGKDFPKEYRDFQETAIFLELN